MFAWLNRSISRQIMALVIIGIAIFSISVSILIGIQSYQDLEDLIQERTNGAAQLFKAEYEREVRRAHTAISNLDVNEAILGELVTLSENGPLYQRPPSASTISEAETHRTIQSQLKLVNGLLTLLPQYGLSQIAVYQLPLLSQFDNQTKLRSLVIDHENIWLYRYFERGNASKYHIYRLPIAEFEYNQALFSNTSVGADTIFKTLGFLKETKPPLDYLHDLDKEHHFSGRTIGLANDEVNVSLWSAISVNMLNPQTNKLESQHASLILGVMLPTQEVLQAIGEQVGSDLSISDKEHVWVSSIDFSQLQSAGYNLSADERPLYFQKCY